MSPEPFVVPENKEMLNNTKKSFVETTQETKLKEVMAKAGTI